LESGRRLALVVFASLTVLGVAALATGLPGKLTARNGTHPTASTGQTNWADAIPGGYVAVGISGPGGPILASIAAGDTADVVATIDTRVLSPSSHRVARRTVFTMVPVIARPKPNPDASSGLYLVMSICDAEYMGWFLRGATSIYVLPAQSEAAPAPAAAECDVGHMGVSGTAVDARWHFTSGPAGAL
jgi:hypothetical protein